MWFGAPELKAAFTINCLPVQAVTTLNAYKPLECKVSE